MMAFFRNYSNLNLKRSIFNLPLFFSPSWSTLLNIFTIKANETES